MPHAFGFFRHPMSNDYSGRKTSDVFKRVSSKTIKKISRPDLL